MEDIQSSALISKLTLNFSPLLTLQQPTKSKLYRVTLRYEGIRLCDPT